MIPSARTADPQDSTCTSRQPAADGETRADVSTFRSPSLQKGHVGAEVLQLPVDLNLNPAGRPPLTESQPMLCFYPPPPFGDSGRLKSWIIELKRQRQAKLI